MREIHAEPRPQREGVRVRGSVAYEFTAWRAHHARVLRLSIVRFEAYASDSLPVVTSPTDIARVFLQELCRSTSGSERARPIAIEEYCDSDSDI